MATTVRINRDVEVTNLARYGIVVYNAVFIKVRLHNKARESYPSIYMFWQIMMVKKFKPQNITALAKINSLIKGTHVPTKTANDVFMIRASFLI